MGIRSWVAEQVLGQVLTDTAAIAERWGDRSTGAKRHLVTVGEARTAFATLAETGHRLATAESALDLHCACHKLQEGDVVGDPKDVHHIIPPHHVIGIAVEECDDGYALTTVEMLHARVIVLRRSGRLIGIGSTAIFRHESYGPCRVI